MTHYAMYTHWLCVWVGGVNVYTDIHYPCSFMISLSLHEVYYTQVVSHSVNILRDVPLKVR